MDGDLVSSDQGPAMNAQAGLAAPGALPGGDVDDGRVALADAPVRRARRMREEGIIATRQHRRQAVTVRPQRSMADGVDARVEADQPLRRNPVPDGRRRRAGSNELRQRHDPVLMSAELRSRLPPSTGGKRWTIERNRPVGGHAASVPGAWRARVAQDVPSRVPPVWRSSPGPSGCGRGRPSAGSARPGR